MSTPSYRVGLSFREVSEATLNKITKENFEETMNQRGFKLKLVDPIKEVLCSAKKVLGTPYKRGASVLYDAPTAFDCSSLVSWAAVEAGFSIPRVTIDQYVFSKRITDKELRPSDLIFANTREIIHTEGMYFSKVLNKEVKEQAIRTETLEYLPGTQVPEGVDHVGIYVGDNKVIHSSSKTGGVVLEDIAESLSFKNIIGYGRIINNDEEKYVINIPSNRPDLKNKKNLLEELKTLLQIRE